jgi:transcriptional regulator with XRE-family HTH domain
MDAMSNHPISQRIQTALELRAMNQAELAGKVGASSPAVSAWVSGKKRPTAENVTAIAAALGVTPAWLQFGTGPGPSPDEAGERADYQSDLRWYWQPTPPDQQRVLGDAAGHAFELRPKTIARETGQNILDERLEGEQTVEAEYTVIELEDGDADAFLSALAFHSELCPHLEACAADQKRKHAAVISSGLKQLEATGRLRLLRIADYNAHGLTGPEFDSGRFMAVCRNTLDSHKSENAGGSYGLGKATMWTSSWMGTVITNSSLSVPEGDIRENRLFVRTELPWHELERHGNVRRFNGPGWFGRWSEEAGCTISYHGNATLASDLYVERTDGRPGTTFLVVGAYDPSGEHDDMEAMANSLRQHLAENFWAAMVPRGTRPPRLKIAVRTQRGRAQVSEQVVDPSDYVKPMVETLRKYYDDELVDELHEPGEVIRVPVELSVPARFEPDPHDAVEHEAVLLVAYTEEPPDSAVVNRVVYLRGNNMTIRDQRMSALPLGARQFHAVLLAGEAAADTPEDRRAERFLRAAEPPAHNRWEGTSEVTTRYARGGVTRLTEFEHAIRHQIREAVRDRGHSGSEGPESLKELLRLASPPDNTKKPRIKKVEATFEPETGAWNVTGSVSVPAGDRWSFAPVVRFGTESGPAINVAWADLSATERCVKEGNRLISDARARTVRFEGVTDPGSYPVSAQRARVRVDLRDVRSFKEQAA